MAKQFVKGNEAIVKGAILAGCRAYYGYPITPASEIAHAAAQFMPLVGGTFLQAESEIAAINMVYGAAGTGIRAMTASSSPGFSLKQEGLSYLAGAELPCVVVDITRGGPGLGNIAPEQADYHQVVKGGGHGNYKNIVLAPNSAQEMCDLTMLAFDLADKYRNPAVVLADGFIGQMMEPVDFPEPVTEFAEKTWAVRGVDRDRMNLVSSIELDPDDLERHNQKLQQKYEIITNNDTRYEEYKLDDAEFVVVGYGIVSRLVHTAVNQLRDEGVKVGMLRPITLMPYPTKRLSELAALDRVKAFSVIELSNGQMVDDVRLAVNGAKPVEFYGRMGGNVPSIKELVHEIKRMMRVL
ncbi:MAG: 3-methyl-2-oxobutanoate dehydrogenase subunit VorB [Candidatus Marinimicrobia bacterium]|jgi:pyruvate/2-oxoacid:ferredoxin oxidoreductase alpha subunit|nr:3-methyl-2-oxobutanoate dehydrogenase subunit VorB [Candidatus Neomarinimicrobiota bacterium]MBT3631979.1 3-methyl-2-oxobutanoate dehydrogenase subunit VorB [Candidatus Neomarinimicrobiota bacterium]MBT3824565.1 3-methyl-2-oxobutanoate dehydrogenase subunit VorB [Candidatus Neomarinimicrobiota bacterium]MBT4130260.1 3-methyl-2-oxobutanoate dehydrogenase subunit VorB [Candidatus Neomarinimicrobiota bacterium]MBT4297011.1 3-methyl-2-oxobutanoate dehydrogenase subunit VorB [Candidatus Neomarini